MDLKPGQYAAALKLIKSAAEALDQLAARVRRQDEASRLRRCIEDTEVLLKKIKRELRIG
jgi:hypothetical protein